MFRQNFPEKGKIIWGTLFTLVFLSFVDQNQGPHQQKQNEKTKSVLHLGCKGCQKVSGDHKKGLKEILQSHFYTTKPERLQDVFFRLWQERWPGLDADIDAAKASFQAPQQHQQLSQQ